MDDKLLISDAAKMVQVESHVLRYWEEELCLPIQRNELGHRFYTLEDVERFRKIKNLKERGLQLRAIKMILKGGKLDDMEEGSLISQLMFQCQATKDSAAMKAMNQSQEKDSMVVKQIQGEKDNVFMSESRGEKDDVFMSESQGENDNMVISESLEEKCSGAIIGSLDGHGFELTSEEITGCGGGMAIEILEIRDLEKGQGEAHRGEEYFKKLDQMLREKSSSDKKKRHFIF
ncbi:MAG: MerR family transcriptional regulator [Lachnospiraceae bacterium]|nr:MerR family transcriptional regulator [Lachnospiraceae bacterium]MBR4604761.1 MerR family transcriptional regulator [Lachnospiraceae bacterium]